MITPPDDSDRPPPPPRALKPRDGEVVGLLSLGMLALSGILWFIGLHEPDEPDRVNPFVAMAVVTFLAALVLSGFAIWRTFRGR